MPPEVILRMMLLLFLDDVKSERELMRMVRCENPEAGRWASTILNR